MQLNAFLVDSVSLFRFVNRESWFVCKSNCCDIIIVGMIISENHLMPVVSSRLAFTERLDSGSKTILRLKNRTYYDIEHYKFSRLVVL